MTNVHKKGFTLVELMIALAVVAILVTLAIPSFRDTLRKSRRSDAMNAIHNLHLAQEKWRVNHATYGSLGNPSNPLTNLGPNPLISADGHYSITFPAGTVTSTSYTILGTAQGDQVNDSCGDFTLTFTAGVITKTTSKGVADYCWRK